MKPLIAIKNCRLPSVLSIAGSDPSGGAGIEADLKTIAAHGLYGMAAITALTVQNTKGVQEVSYIPPDFVCRQIEAVIRDIRPDAIKIGMIGDKATAAAIADTLCDTNISIVFDPVLTSTSGMPLASKNDSFVRLMSLCNLVTPNIPEAEVFYGGVIRDIADMKKCAEWLSYTLGGVSVLIKGGHLEGSCDDVLYSCGECSILTASRVENPNTHGTGCTLSSAIACGLAQGETLSEAVQNAKIYITGAIAAKLAIGHGRGPLDHMWEYRQ